MKMLAFARRTAREILRDPLNILFGLGFPVVLLLLFSAIQANVPFGLFRIESITPGIAVFGLSFVTLFSATLIAKDRESALLQRLYTTPLTAVDFILGYALPMLPIALAQLAVCYLTAILLGLPVTGGIVWAIFALLPATLFFIALGLLCGSVLNVKQVGGVCGALLTNAAALLSGAWFDLALVGGAFEKAANLLPFAHAVQLGRIALGSASGVGGAAGVGSAAGTAGAAAAAGIAAASAAGSSAGVHLAWTAVYAAVAAVAAALLFLRQMKQ